MRQIDKNRNVGQKEMWFVRGEVDVGCSDKERLDGQVLENGGRCGQSWCSYFILENVPGSGHSLVEGAR